MSKIKKNQTRNCFIAKTTMEKPATLPIMLRISLWVGPDTLFGKLRIELGLVWIANVCRMNFKIFVRWVKKLKHLRVGNECRVICLSVSFFISSLIFHFHCQFAALFSLLRLCMTVEAKSWRAFRSTSLSNYDEVY